MAESGEWGLGRIGAMAGTRETAVSESVAAASESVVAASEKVAAIADVGAGGNGVVFVGALLT